ncbi:MAG: hypothetical protein Q9164_003924, partial [Protoblastenia rupestris]
MDSLPLEERFDVVVVGAGWYGLIAAYYYQRLVPSANLLIVDNGNSVGGVWSKEKIYPNLFAQVGHGLFEYSFYPMKKENLTPDRYIGGETINRYLNDFARDYDLVRRIRLRTHITKVEHLDQDGWRLIIDGAPAIRADRVVYATGVSSDMYVPQIPKDNFHKPVIHSGQIGTSLESLQGPDTQRATVVGAAKSSYDTVFLLIKSGKKVDWIIREDGSGPLAIMPPRLMGVLNTVDVMATRALASFSPAILNTRGVWYKCLHKTRVGRFMVKAFWRTVAGMAESHAGYHRNVNAAKLRPIPHGYGIFWANSGLGLASVPDFWKTFHTSDCTVHRTEIASLSEKDTITLKNGTKITTDYLILCTGWTHNLGTFDEALRAKIGLPSKEDLSVKWQKLDAHGEQTVNELLPFLRNPPDTTSSVSERRPWRLFRRLVSPNMSSNGDRSIFFPGQIHSVFTPLVAELQALWGVAFMLRLIDVPARAEMEQEIAVWNAWTRKRYLEMGRKHAYSIYDYLAYVDTLCRDLGIRPNRKGNPITEMFQPYRPSDYNGLFDEFLDAQAKKARLEEARRNLGGYKKPLLLA